METVRAIVLTTCVLSLFSGILDALRPSRKFDRQMHFLLSAVFLLALLAPLAYGLDEWNFDWTANNSVSDTLTEETQRQTIAYATENLEQNLMEYLQENNFADAKVSVEMHIVEDGSIEINRILVSCTNPEEAASLLTTYLGKEVTIDVEDVSEGTAGTTEG